MISDKHLHDVENRSRFLKTMELQNLDESGLPPNRADLWRCEYCKLPLWHISQNHQECVDQFINEGR